jgi:hypothetical protein
MLDRGEKAEPVLSSLNDERMWTFYVDIRTGISNNEKAFG